MATISLCMIVKNEESVLKKCLSSCKNLFDEIIIVDTGSDDSTKCIAKMFTDKIFDFKWVNDFSKARNFAFSKATCDYIMWLDADDVIPKKSLTKLMDLKNFLSKDVYMLKYNIAFANNKPTFSYYRERIMKNCNKAFWQGAVHECITPFGEIERLNIAIDHKKTINTQSDRNLKIYENLLKNRPLSPREQYYYGRELYDHKKFSSCVKVLKNFVNSKNGWVENVIDALFLISNCYQFLNKEEKQFDSLIETFKYDSPRANICCQLGDINLKNKRYTQAIDWYKIAIKCEDVSLKGGFVESFYYNYYPYLQLCYCFFCLNDIKNAEKYNNLAGKIYKSDIYLNNKKYFENL